jgi:transcriptional regulator with PAS, ATPase and Fis domain
MGNLTPNLDGLTEDAGKNALFDFGLNHVDANWRQYFPEIIASSHAMDGVLEGVYKISRSDSPVLILGESGTGKELIASAIHRLSNRSSKRFVAINCSAIPEDLLEAELFGHEKGAFTGADRRRQGHFEVASGGVIFLDEIGEMSPRLQSKLLRVIQEMQFTPIGSSEVKKADVRIVAATNVNLEQAVNQGQFRLDLYYRLNVLPIQLPPLRERGDDTTALLDFFTQRANLSHRLANPCWFSDLAKSVLKHYSWPGNIRQLQNLVERLVVMKGGGKIDLADLPQEYQAPEANHREAILSQGTLTLTHENRKNPIPSQPSSTIMMPSHAFDLPSDGFDLAEYIETLENNLIMQALQKTGNNKNQAAKLLGLNRTTLVERIKKRKLTGSNCQLAARPDET